MLKRDVFSNAMQAGLYKKLAWLITAFTQVEEDPDEWKKNPYPWRLVQLSSGIYFVDEQAQLQLIEDAAVGQRPYDQHDPVVLTSQDMPTVQGEITTTYGNWFINWLLLYSVFGAKIAYMQGDITPSRIEAILIKNFHDNPADGEQELPDRFYVREYLDYMRALFFLPGLAQVCVWAATPKTLQAAPGIEEYKAQLLEQNKEKLNDLATIAKIDSELVKYDLQYLKGDPGMNFLRGGKAVEVVRKKKYGMMGAEVGLDDNASTGVLIKNSLSQGWEIDKIPEMFTTVRSGSYDRGAQTMLGGVSVKWLLRASANMQITTEDCGSKVGMPTLISKKLVPKLVGMTLTDGKSDTKITTEEQAGTYLGKLVNVRSPMFCHLELTDFCKVCCGDRLAINPEGLSVTISDYGSTILNIFLKKMHGKKLSTAVMDYRTAIQ